MKKKTLALTLAALMLAAALTGCGSGSTDEVQDDSTVTVLAGATSTSFDPLVYSTTDVWVKNALFDHLVRFDENGEIAPMLAESWEDDGMTVALHLRQGAVSHDGEPINADDVIFSLDTMLQDPTFYFLSTYMASWEKVDEYTVAVTKAAAYCKVLEVLATYVPIVSMEAYESMGAEAFAESPVGTGPYTFTSLGSDNVVTLTAFADYWDGAPAFETLRVRPPIDMATAVIGLENGEIDVIANVPASQWSILEGNEDVVLDTTTGWAQMTLNMLNSMTEDINLRKAIYHGINRANAAIVATEGTAVEAVDIYADLVMGDLAGTFDVPGYDVELAQEYLAQSDYVAGTPIVITATTAEDVAVAQSIQNDLGQIGITVEINQVDANNLSSMLLNGELALYSGTMGGPYLALADMLLYWETDNPTWGPQVAHDERYDEICQLLRTETDEDVITELTREAMQIQYDLCNFVGPYTSVFSMASRADIEGATAMNTATLCYYPGDLAPAGAAE